MKAAEAKKITDKIVLETLKREINVVFSQIKSNANEGLYEIKIIIPEEEIGNIDSRTRLDFYLKALEEEGYTSVATGRTINIKWEKINEQK